jgi:xanthine dehydrogenase large subunit
VHDGDANARGDQAVGEPPLVLAISVYKAMRDAVASVAQPGQCVVLEALATAEHALAAIELSDHNQEPRITEKGLER